MTFRFALLCAVSMAFPARAEILFEAFYRIEKNNQHTGYVVQRLSSDKEGQRVLSTYVRTRGDRREYFTTSKSVAKAGSGAPVETEHTTASIGAPATISAKFDNGQGSVAFTSNYARKPNRVETVRGVPYPSAFMYFLTDFTKFQAGQKYTYKAFFEESGLKQVGQLSLLDQTEAAGQRVYHILNDDSRQAVESFVAANGQPLGSRSIATGITCFWVATKEEAVGDMAYPTSEMAKLFGDLPLGKKNVWSQIPDFAAGKMIDHFRTWTGQRTLSYDRSEKVLPLPLPLRKLP